MQAETLRSNNMTVKDSEDVALEARRDDSYEVLSTRDVAKIMKCGVRKVQRMASTGQLPMKRFGSEYVISRKRLQEYLDS
jgi:excisionase family DNA binding protein